MYFHSPSIPLTKSSTFVKFFMNPDEKVVGQSAFNLNGIGIWFIESICTV
jgi:hypothetical protein